MTDIAVSALTVGCLLPLVFLLVALVWTGIRSGWRGGYRPPSFEEWQRDQGLLVEGKEKRNWKPAPKSPRPPAPMPQKPMCGSAPEIYNKRAREHPDWCMEAPICHLERGHEGRHVCGDLQWEDVGAVRTQVRFELPDHLHDVAQAILEKNNAGSGEKWTLDEMCRRWVCEVLRQERDKAPDFGKGLKDEN